MERKDHLGLAYSGASPAALDDYLKALSSFYCYVGDPISLLSRATADSPQFVMAHLLNGYLHLIGSNAEAQAVSRASHAAASTLPMNAREVAHVHALGLLLQNRLWDASRAYEDLLVQWPLDALALQVAQIVDFLVGDSRMLRDRAGRVMPLWSRDMPDYHAVLAGAAFGLEETGQYGRAEAAGLEALEVEPRNTWATHAVAHVFEMENRRREGAAWMAATEANWAPDSFFAVHNWWHRGLFHLGLGEVDETLRIYDQHIYGTPSPMQFDMVDASAMLWRLMLKGVEPGGRWEAIADGWEADVASWGGVSTYPFNDFHAMLAFTGSGRTHAARELLETQARGLEVPGDGPMLLSEVGIPATRAIHAFGEGRYGECVELLRPVRNRAARFGGSHAQRDLIDQTLIEAARRDGQADLVAALEAERGYAKPEGAEVEVYSRAA